MAFLTLVNFQRARLVSFQRAPTEQVLVSDTESLLLPGVRVVTTRDYPWVAELMGHEQGDVVALASAPYAGMRAVIDSVLDLDRWNVSKAAELVQSVPSSTTGVTAFSGSIDQLGEQIRQQAQDQRHQRSAVLQKASAERAWIGLAAASMHVSPRAFLRKQADWRPTGHSGMAPDIEFDDVALRKATRCVLDPVSLLLLMDLGVDTALASMPTRLVMTPQAVDLLFDWWYSLERVQRGTRGTLVAMPDGRVAIHELTSEHRLHVRRFWLRVKTFITEYVEIVASPAISEKETLNIARVLGPGIVSGMALAKERGWAYLAEELMIYGAARHIVGSPAASLHRFLVHCAQRRWCTDATVVEWLATLIRQGWRWVGYPSYMLATALGLPEARRWRVFKALLMRLRRADLPVAMSALDTLFRQLDAGRYVGVSVRRARELLLAALPPQLTKEHLETWAEQYSGKPHAATRRALKDAAKSRGRMAPLRARIDEEGHVDDVDADALDSRSAEEE
ncbi:hypothetical protein CS053_10100 [Rhodanobacter glycinis]|uniref:PIN domain-containing protein n=1 Tax=Rhodanobacter glycinis TaxID=582702 RepID=A0A5B9E2Q4_9GAMM|nr:hypothetical protein [Rhodanobacter glycinis]QEE24810.1 hypothetical protein CS053_10100 [Rhodanobacter glycinis]